MLARQGQIAVTQEVAQPSIGWIQSVYNDVAIFGSQAGFVRITEAFRKHQDRAVIRRFLGFLRQLRIELVNNIRDGHFRFKNASRHTLAEPVNGPIHQQDELFVPLQIVVIILDCLERRCTLTAGKSWIKSMIAEKVVERADHGEVHDVLGETL